MRQEGKEGGICSIYKNLGSNLTITLKRTSSKVKKGNFRLSDKNFCSYMLALSVNVYLKDVLYEWDEVCVCIERLGMW